MSNEMILKVKKLHPDAVLPEQATEGAAGFDLYSVERHGLYTHDIVSLSTGIAVEIPVGYEGQIRSRSGLAKRGISVINSPGTIDSDYRGEVRVLLINLGDDHYVVMPGDRIAQLVIAPIAKVDEVIIVDELSETERGSGGFGSTGR